MITLFTLITQNIYFITIIESIVSRLSTCKAVRLTKTEKRLTYVMLLSSLINDMREISAFQPSSIRSQKSSPSDHWEAPQSSKFAYGIEGRVRLSAYQITRMASQQNISGDVNTPDGELICLQLQFGTPPALQRNSSSDERDAHDSAFSFTPIMEKWKYRCRGCIVKLFRRICVLSSCFRFR